MATGWPMKTTYANGDVYSASDVNDITGTINLLGSSVAYAAGKNKIINSDFGVWQRGTSFTATGYTADRWLTDFNGTGSTNTASRQTFTPGTAPVSGYEGTYFYRFACSVAGTGNTYKTLNQRIEDVRVFAGQTVTVSFWAKAAANTTINNIYLSQVFGSGGSGDVTTNVASTTAFTTSWQRFTYSVALPSISGKTIGTNSWLGLQFNLPTNATFTLDFWGVQVEQGSTATAFQTATGTIQGELAACQRYYYQHIDANDKPVMNAGYFTANIIIGVIPLPVTMRTSPTISVTNGTSYWVSYANGAADLFDNIGFGIVTSNTVNVEGTGNVAGTSGYAGNIRSNNASAKLGMSAEL